MNDQSTIEAQVIGPPPNPSTFSKEHARKGLVWWQRLLIAFGYLIVAGGAGAGLWMVGILMFTFSLDGANSQDLPEWLDVFMLVGWPVSIGLVALVPACCILLGLNWRWWLGSFLATAFISVAVYVGGLVAVFSSLS